MDKERKNIAADVWNFFVPRNDSLFRVLFRTPIDGAAVGFIAYNVKLAIDYPYAAHIFVLIALPAAGGFIIINRHLIPPIRTPRDGQPHPPPQIPPGPPTGTT